MIKKEKKLIVTFFTTSGAMATEKVCKAKGIDGQLISAPRELTPDCGISFATAPSNEDLIRKTLDEQKIEYDKIVVIEI